MNKKEQALAILGGISRSIPILGSFDALGIGRFMAMLGEGDSGMCTGVVMQYNPNTMTALVRMTSKRDVWTCSFVDDMATNCFGYSSCTPPMEGDIVAVVPDAARADSGMIVGRMAVESDYTKGDGFKDPEDGMRRSWTLGSAIDGRGTDSDEIPAYSAPLENANDPSTHIRTSFRPTDVLPGEMAILNQHNCGLRGGAMSFSMFGGGASVRTSALLNSIRMVCQSYAKHSMSSTEMDFQNGRNLSSERNVALYQEERLGSDREEDGADGLGSKVWTEDSKAPRGGLMQTMRARFKEYSGYFGHLLSRFFLRPDPSDDELRVMGASKPKEEGVARETVDPSGQYRLAAAGMITLERTGRIPIPVRVALPTDKGHDIGPGEKLTPFEHDDKNPSMRILELYDRQAYDLKTQYARVDGLGIGTDKSPDHYVPQEEDLAPLGDEYDPKYYGNSTVKLKKYDGRRAGVYIGEDGSLIMRDAWGSEVAMVGGNITISCAGNVQILPGKTALTVAGDDIVQKAQNSVDIHASEHDVRLSAARNMEIVGGADDEAHQGGVIIESKGKSKGPWDGKDKGESASVSGITLKAANQNVVVDGYDVVLRAKEHMRMVAGDESVDGKIDMSAKTMRQYAESLISASDESMLRMDKGAVNLAAASIMLRAKSGFMVTRGSKAPAITWEELADGKNPAEDFLESAKSATEGMSNEKEASGGYGREELDKMVFGFRTSQECGTTESWDIGGSGPFTMYEPAWAQVSKTFGTLKSSIGTGVYKEDGKWSNGRPFPGLEVQDEAIYAKLSGERPVNLTEDGFNANRSQLKQASEVDTSSKLESSYIIRSQTNQNTEET